MIEKLDYYMGKTSYDGFNWVERPTRKDFIDKINEIIDVVNEIKLAPIVYCIDCVHRVYDEEYDQYRCNQTGWYDGDYFYCADGEKKDGNNE